MSLYNLLAAVLLVSQALFAVRAFNEAGGRSPALHGAALLIEEPKVTAPTDPPPATPQPSPAPSASTTHVIRPGDTLYAIARRYAVDPALLAQVNHIEDPSRIYAGQTLIVPVNAPLPPATTAPGREMLIPPHMISLLLLGADGNGDSHWRTDSIMLIAVNPRTGRTGMLSIPRDLWVDIPGYGADRINTVDFAGENMEYPGGGPALLREVLRENLGLTYDHYARICFDGFVHVIDTLGGVDVTVEKPLEDLFPHPTEPGEVVYLNLEPGIAHLDGVTALAYARSRYSTSDFDRARRQQDIIAGLWRKLLQRETIGQIPMLYRELRSAVVTDLSLMDIVQLLLAGMTLQPDDAHTLVIDLKLTRNWVTSKGSMVLLPDREALDVALKDFFAELDRPAETPTAAPTPTPMPAARWSPTAGRPFCWGCPE